jgi:NADPH:quinone reductase-like Zn-dependent oxidoreductase
MKTMKAVRAHRKGGPEQLVFEEAPVPEPAQAEILVAVHAASITPDELTWTETWTDTSVPGGRDRAPIIPSHEMSGVVVAVGAGVTEVEPGDDVYGLIPFARDGAAAEYASVPASLVAAKPGTVDHQQAAAIPLSALTAWQALVDHAAVQRGQHVLVHGGAGGVSTYAVQLAAHLGARVTATARRSDKDFVLGLGAATVIGYQDERFDDELSDVDVVLDLVGGDTQARSWRVLRRGGILVSIVAPPDPEVALQSEARGVFFVVKPDRGQLQTIATLVDEGAVTPVVGKVLPLSDARAAYEGLDREHHRGKVVLEVVG